MYKLMRKENRNLSPAEAVASAYLESSVKNCDVQAVRDFINQNPRVPKWFTPSVGYRLMYTAVANRDRAMVALLLLLNPPLDIEVKSKNHQSPLWTALMNCEIETSRLLIEAGADLHKPIGHRSWNDPKSKVLHFLMNMAGRERLIDLVIERGADVNALDTRGETPLHYAVNIKDTRFAAKLIAGGANVNAKDLRGNTPLLTICRRFAAEDMVQLLLRNGADVFVRDNEGCNALHLLANAGFEHAEVAKILLERDVPLDEVDNVKQYTPLHYAVAKGKQEVTKMFLDNGADVNGWEGCPTNPILLAAAQKSPYVLELLLLKEANTKHKTKKGKTALHIACKNAQQHNISILLEYGADINAKDDDGATPFSLMEHKANLSWGVQAMIRAIAKRTVLDKPTTETDLGMIKEYPLLERFYNECLNELEDMRKARLFGDLPYFSLFSKTLYKLALLLRDDRFEFPLKLKNINELFPTYGKDFNRALRRAELLNVDLNRIENYLTDMFADELPSPVIREMMRAVLPSYVHA